MKYKIDWKEESLKLTELLQYENNISPTEKGVLEEIEFILGVNGFSELWSLELEILYKYISNGGKGYDFNLKDIEELYKIKYDEEIKEVLK